MPKYSLIIDMSIIDHAVPIKYNISDHSPVLLSLILKQHKNK